MRLLLICIVLCSVVSCRQTKKKLAVNPVYLIVPGQGVGALKLNASAKPVYDSLGRPDKGDAAMGKALALWYMTDSVTKEPCQLRLFTTMNMGNENFHRIKLIRTTCAQFRLKDGLGVGSTYRALAAQFQLQALDTLKSLNRKIILFTTDQGIAFEIDSTQLCRGIVVFPQKTNPLASYIPLYEEY